jgi:hypothetical protein
VAAVNIDLMPYRWYRRNVGIMWPDLVFPGTHYRRVSLCFCFCQPAPDLVWRCSVHEMQGYNLLEFMNANFPRHRMFLCGILPAWDSSWSGHYIMWAFGLSGEFLRNNDVRRCCRLSSRSHRVVCGDRASS